MRIRNRIHLFYLLSIPICVLIYIGVYGNVESIQRTSKAANLDSKEFSINQKLTNQLPVTIVAYGDSITWGYDRDPIKGKVNQVKYPYPTVLEKELRKKYGYHNIKVINKGHPGWTSIQALENLEKEVLSYRPDLVISMFGINDARGHNKYSPNALPVPVDQYKENNQQLLQMIKENGLEVVIISATAFTSKKNSADKTQSHYTNAIQSLAQEEKVQYVNGTEIPIKGNLSDGVHFKADQYKLIAEKLMLDVFGAY